MITIEEKKERNKLKMRKWRLKNPNSCKEYYYSNHEANKEKNRKNTEKWRRGQGIKEKVYVSKEDQRKKRNLYLKEYRQLKPPKKYCELTQEQKNIRNLRSKLWRQRNPDYKVKRQELLIKSTFGDYSNQIKIIYLNAKLITLQTGIKHEVDHIIPLKGKNVTGLNVPWNLRIIPASENRQKSNKVSVT